MRWKDLPIRKRLLAANYLMILTPVLCFMVLSVGIFWIFGIENLNRASVLSFIWPESGPTLSIQFELTRLRSGQTITTRTNPNLCCWSVTIWKTRGSGYCWNGTASPSM